MTKLSGLRPVLVQAPLEDYTSLRGLKSESRVAQLGIDFLGGGERAFGGGGRRLRK